MKLLIKSAKIIDINSKFNETTQDILIVDGIIKKISENINEKSDIKYTSPNLHVSIGWMDSHSNFREPGYEHKDDINSGTRSAIKGGFTSVMLMPKTKPIVDNKSIIEFIKNKSKNSILDIHVSSAVSKNMEGKDLVEMHDINSVGCRVFTDDKNSIENNELLKLALLYSKDFNGTIMNFPNDRILSKNGTMNEGKNSTYLGLKGIPNVSEEIMLDRDISLAKYTKGNLHCSYISTKESVKKIRKSKKEGLNLTADVSINNLIMTDDMVKNYDSNYKVLPPLRSENDIISLIKAIKDGTIDVISSDHSPENSDNKIIDFDNAKFGVIGLESFFGLACNKLLKHIDLSIIIEKISSNPRRIFLNQYLKINEGEKANLTLFNPNIEWKFNKKDVKSKSNNTPFIGKKLLGKALAICNNNKFQIID
tara:strand:+ start:11100 stop:12368 length:1269 start_codon:yes stop_codon:yes gene_type:complete